MLKQLMQMQMQQMQQQNQPNPYIEQLLGLNKSIVDWHTGTGVKDIYKHPTIGGQLPVFQFAKTMRDASRVGRGIAGLGDKLDPRATHQQSIEDSYNRDIAAKGILEQGLSNEFSGAESNIANLSAIKSNIGSAWNSGANAAIGNLINLGAGQGGFWGSLGRGLVGGLSGGLGSGLGGLV